MYLCLQSVKLVDLLDEARERCRATIKERRGDDISEEELEASSCAMGYGAVKYADLKNNRVTSYRFVLHIVGLCVHGLLGIAAVKYI